MNFSTWLSRFQRKYDQYIDELGLIGESVANTMFATANGEDGNWDVRVQRTDEGQGNFRISAQGDSVMFLEFGAGVTTGTIRDTIQSDVEIAPGSWSREDTQEFSRYGSWHYQGKKYVGIQPTSAMQEACNSMEQQSPIIVRRVFR